MSCSSARTEWLRTREKEVFRIIRRTERKKTWWRPEYKKTSCVLTGVRVRWPSISKCMALLVLLIWRAVSAPTPTITTAFHRSRPRPINSKELAILLLREAIMKRMLLPWPNLKNCWRSLRTSKPWMSSWTSLRCTQTLMIIDLASELKTFRIQILSVLTWISKIINLTTSSPCRHKTSWELCKRTTWNTLGKTCSLKVSILISFQK